MMKKKDLDKFIQDTMKSMLPLIDKDESTKQFKEYTEKLTQIFGSFLEKEEMYAAMMSVEESMIKNSQETLLNSIKKEKLLDNLEAELSPIEIEYMCEKFAKYWFKHRQELYKKILGIE